MDDYRFCKNAIIRYFQPDGLQFKRRDELTRDEVSYNLLVVRAPEPSELMWENLEYSHKTKVLARFKSNMVTFGLLLASFVVIFFAYEQKAIFEKNLLDFTFCGDELPSVFWGKHDNLPTDVSLVRNRSMDDGQAAGGCPRGYYHITFANETIATATRTGTLPDMYVPANNTHAAHFMTRSEVRSERRG